MRGKLEERVVPNMIKKEIPIDEFSESVNKTGCRSTQDSAIGLYEVGRRKGNI